MKFFLCTAHGNLDQFYSGATTGLLFQGVCQGNSAGSAIWLVVSIVLMDMVWNNGSTASFTLPLSCQTMNLVGLLYMDNCNLFTINVHGLTPMDTVQRLQTNINLWQGGLVVTGGELSPSKYLWCLLSSVAPG